jgi:hypothetical protein
MSETTATPEAVAALVDLVLARTGLKVTPKERERLIRIYPSMAEWTGAVRLAETRDAEPALVYPAIFER